MTARTHDLAALTALGVIVLLSTSTETVTLSTLFTAFIANQIGGITPDIDQPTAPLWRNLPIGRVFGKMFGKLIGGHRFITHSLVGLVLFGFVSNMLLLALHPIMPSVDTTLVWQAFMVGMVSHLVMDSFTKEGVPWLLPIPIKFGFPPIKALRITTGKVGEKFLFIAIVLVDGWYVTSHYGRILEIFHSRII